MRAIRATLITAVVLSIGFLPSEDTGTARGTEATSSATLEGWLSPDRLEARTAVSVRASLPADDSGTSPAVRQITVMLPQGLENRLEWPETSGCSSRHLRRHGARGCGARSELGRGEAVIGWREGQREVTERASLRVFLAPTGARRNWNLFMTRLWIVGEGMQPIHRRFLLPAALAPIGSKDYAALLKAAIPVIATRRGSSSASLLRFALTLGAAKRPRFSGRGLFGGMGLFVPSVCPPHGFPWLGEFTYANGSMQEATAVSPCP